MNAVQETTQAPPDIPFRELAPIAGKRVLAYDEQLIRAAQAVIHDGKLCRQEVSKVIPMQKTEGIDDVPVGMVLKVLDRCRHFEKLAEDLQAKNNGLRGQLENLRREIEAERIQRQTVNLEEKSKRKGQ